MDRVGENGISKNEGVRSGREGEPRGDQRIDSPVGMIGDHDGGAGFGNFGREFFLTFDSEVEILAGRVIGIAMTHRDGGHHVAESGQSDQAVELLGQLLAAARAGEKGILLCERKKGVWAFILGRHGGRLRVGLKRRKDFSLLFTKTSRSRDSFSSFFLPSWD